MVELSRTPRAKGGWTEEETKRLFEEAKIADSEGRSVKSVFDKISRLTGRKPNSIRNYYYLKLKENGIETKTAFIPFEEDEVYTLLRSMLKGQAEGKSVRGIALQMANGDKKTMLRYQNKYRSLIKTDPQIVKKTILELKDEGVCCKNPLKSIKHEKKDITALISELVENLTIAGIDPEELIDSLNDLARLAANGKEPSEYKRNDEGEENRLNRIIKINKSFIELDGIERITGLAKYISELSAAVYEQ